MCVFLHIYNCACSCISQPWSLNTIPKSRWNFVDSRVSCCYLARGSWRLNYLCLCYFESRNQTLTQIEAIIRKRKVESLVLLRNRRKDLLLRVCLSVSRCSSRIILNSSVMFSCFFLGIVSFALIYGSHCQQSWSKIFS